MEGAVFADLNDNGVRDEGENGLPGVTVRLMSDEGEAFSAVIGEDGKYLFDANGKIIINDRNGIDNGIYYVNGVATYAGVVYIDGYYYYADSKGVIFKNGTKQIFGTRANNLLQPGVYTFDADGRITDAEGRVIQEDYIAEQ